MKRRKKPRERSATSELEEVLATRLRQLEWPKPSPETKQRCLSQILERMENQEPQPQSATRPQTQPSARGLGDRHSLTRRVAAFAHREPLSASRRPVRIATVLW